MEVELIPIVKPNIVETYNNTIICENNESLELSLSNQGSFNSTSTNSYEASWYRIEPSGVDALVEDNAFNYSSNSAFTYTSLQWGTATQITEDFYVLTRSVQQLGCFTSDTITITIKKSPDAPSIVRTSTQTPTNISLCDGDESRYQY